MLNVMVTGGSRGLGLGIVRALAKSGFRVMAIARSENEATIDAREQVTKDHAGELHFRSFDLADINAIGDWVKTLRRDFGDFYGIVNNAAIGPSGILTNMSDSTIDQTVRLNVLSSLILTKHVLRSMMLGTDGRIVNVSSIVSENGYSGLSVYSATKSALVGFTRSLAREVGPLGITVNAVAPGFVDTEMTHAMSPSQRAQVARRSALQRLPTIADVANTVDFLFSERARNITGTVITVDAGNTA